MVTAPAQSNDPRWQIVQHLKPLTPSDLAALPVGSEAIVRLDYMTVQIVKKERESDTANIGYFNYDGYEREVDLNETEFYRCTPEARPLAQRVYAEHVIRRAIAVSVHWLDGEKLQRVRRCVMAQDPRYDHVRQKVAPIATFRQRLLKLLGRR